LVEVAKSRALEQMDERIEGSHTPERYLCFQG
jgi:hypothetical protein